MMKSEPVRISCVSFLNSLPFLQGLKSSHFSDPVQVSLDSPAECAAKLAAGIADVGLVPVATIPRIEGAEIITEWCIGADGPVRSVLLVSHVPLSQVKRIIPDYHSVTSNNLVRILCARQWHINPDYINSFSGYESQISGETAGIVIGDRALKLQGRFPFVFDLADEWKKMTGLPFVFARWVSTKELSPVFIREFSHAMETGIDNIDTLLARLKSEPGYDDATESYLKETLKFRTTPELRKGMDLFLKYSSQIPVFSGSVTGGHNKVL